jgi:hypothetical protein
MRTGRIAPILVTAFALSVTAWSLPVAAQQPRPQAAPMNAAERRPAPSRGLRDHHVREEARSSDVRRMDQTPAARVV